MGGDIEYIPSFNAAVGSKVAVSVLRKVVIKLIIKVAIMLLIKVYLRIQILHPVINTPIQ